MWSGPRNISTALLRAWGSRADTIVCDEPLYAHYLDVTGIDHPGREEIIAHHDADWRSVVEWLIGPLPEGKAVFYQKHMAHHLLPEIKRDWLGELVNCFLIRDPAEMITSLIKVTPEPTLADTGLPQQVEIFKQVLDATGSVPPVLDSKDVLDDPRKLLGLLCESIGIAFDEAMLTWQPGPRDTDGIWAKHWYGAVEQSTGFKPFTLKNEPVPDRHLSLLIECQSLYDYLWQFRCY